MIRRITGILLIGMISGATLLADSPMVSNVGMADPHIFIFNNKAYMFAGHDSDIKAKNFVMPDWEIWSSNDLVNWTLEQTISPTENYMGKSNFCWAADVALKNGKYYFYFSNGNKNAGVMVSDSPTRPFTDALGKPLLPEDLTPGKEYDPTILTDDDHKTYIAFGHYQSDDKTLRYHIARLNSDMISLAEAPKEIEIIDDAKVLTGNDKPTLHKRNGIYYLSAGIHYATSNNIYGPYTRIGDSGNGEHDLNGRAHGNYFTWNGQWFHTWCHFYQGIDVSRYRESYLTYIHYKDNGEMVDDVAFLKDHFSTGVGQYDASWDKIEAEWFMSASGISKNEIPNSGFAITDIENNDYLIFPNFKGLSGKNGIEFEVVVRNKSAKIEIHKDSPKGELLASCNLKVNNSGTGFKNISCNLPKMADKQNLCLVFKGKGEKIPELDSFLFR